MFGLFRRQYDLTPQHVRTDVHCHLLPGVDDGVATHDQAIEIMQRLQQVGYCGLILTPHIYPEVFDNEEAELLAVFSVFRNQARRHCPDLRLQLAAEYWLDERLLRRLHDHPARLLRLGAGNDHLLIELSTLMKPPIFDEMLAQCQRHGLRPIIAHVERYSYAHSRNYAQLRQWKEQGALLQMNVGSVAGQYGRSIAQVARSLWRAELIDLLGTDLHGEQHVITCQQGWEQLQRLPGAGGFDPTVQACLK